jgi:tetratricopeptide (TPR) repeat protein
MPAPFRIFAFVALLGGTAITALPAWAQSQTAYDPMAGYQPPPAPVRRVVPAPFAPPAGAPHPLMPRSAEANYDSPAYAAPAYREPSYAPPAYAPPAYRETNYPPPVYRAPAYSPPAYSDTRPGYPPNNSPYGGPVASAPSANPPTTAPTPPSAQGKIASPYPSIPQAAVPKSAEARWAQCAGNAADATRDSILTACSALIDAGTEPNSRMAKVFANRGRAWHAMGQYKAAIADFDKSLWLAPKDSDTLQARCMSHAVTGQIFKALADCNQSLTLKPDNLAALESRGFTYRKMRAFHRSVADYDAVLKREPQRASALFGRGVARLDSGDRDGEIDVKQAKALESNVAQEFARYGIYR